jgi:TonB family protein
VTRRFGGAFGASLALHSLLAVGIMAILAVRAERVASQTPPPKLNLVYMATAKATPAGGGGGRRGESAPRPTEIPRHRQPIAVTVAPPELPKVEPLPTLDVRVETNAASAMQATGASLTAPPGPGNRGEGPGLGGGKGPGVNDGREGGTGGGPKMPGGDVSNPSVIRDWKPEYTPEALQARVQGAVTLEVVVLANGTVGRVTVVKSLHPGLDQKAVEAAKKWLFQPGRHKGEAVDVIVTLILEFRLH